MDDRVQGFLRQLVHQAINASLHTVIWRMPVWGALVLLAVLVSLVYWMGWY